MFIDSCYYFSCEITPFFSQLQFGPVYKKTNTKKRTYTGVFLVRIHTFAVSGPVLAYILKMNQCSTRIKPN